MDAADRTILDALCRDSTTTLAALAHRAGLSVSAVHARVKRLESLGVIAGYRAMVDNEQLGLPLTAFVAITPLDPAQPDNAPAVLAQIKGVEACYSVAGEESYLLLVRAASPRILERLLQQIRAVANVRTRTTIALQTFFEHRLNVPD
jgi:Lrp/AsnC family leucine-responsive transcriptional regulator